jgi:hypothetical protein
MISIEYFVWNDRQSDSISQNFWVAKGKKLTDHITFQLVFNTQGTEPE